MTGHARHLANASDALHTAAHFLLDAIDELNNVPLSLADIAAMHANVQLLNNTAARLHEEAIRQSLELLTVKCVDQL